MILNPYAPPKADVTCDEPYDRLTAAYQLVAVAFFSLGVLEVLLRGFDVTFRLAVFWAAFVFVCGYLIVANARPRLDRKSSIGLLLATSIFLVHVSILSEARYYKREQLRAAVSRLRTR